jgi:hypothetical protein
MPRYIPPLSLRELIKAGYLYDLIKAGRLKVNHMSPTEWRFWAKVDKDGPIPAHKPYLGKCWLWKGYTHNGYGRFRILYKITGAHTYSYFLADKGEQPLRPGEYICHECDNPACVNPTHLRRDTPQGNADDMTDKQRQSIGEHRPNAKLTDAIVKECRTLYIPGHPTRGAAALARKHRVQPRTMLDAILGNTWKHLELRP